MDKLTKKVLKGMLMNKNSLQEITDFCRHKKVCQEHKYTVCKKSLQVSGYSVPKDTDTCKIFGELLQISRNSETKDNKNPLAMTEDILEYVNLMGSKKLKEFIHYNGYAVDFSRSSRTRLTRAKSYVDFDTLQI